MSIHYPSPLTDGHLIGIAAPAGPFPLDRFQQGLARLTSLGFRTKIPDQVFDRNGFLAGSDRDRAQTFNDLLADPEVGMIVAARGGYGVMRILDRIDYSLVRAHPKIIVGFSDLTALLLSITDRTGLVTYHGPVVTHLTDLDEKSIQQFRDTITGRNVFPLSLTGTEILVPGQAKGPLIGGNLTILVHMLAADRLPDLEGAVLFLEDVEEAPYRIDRMMTTFRLAGILDKVAGIILGEFKGCGTRDELYRIMDSFLARLDIPVVLDFPIGHGKRNLTLPVGAEMILDTGPGILDLTEPGSGDDRNG